MSRRTHGLSTTAIHGTPHRKSDWMPVVPPLVQSSTFTNPVGSSEEVLYTRYGNNPNQVEIAERYALLEGAESAIFLSSGMGATALAHLAVLRPGDHLISSSWIYGGTRKLFDEELSRWGIAITYCSPDEPRQWRKALRKTTRAIFVETPTNPLVRVLDLGKVAQIARESGLALLVDSTFASPINFRPLEHGADVVITSATKYLNGHNGLKGHFVSFEDPVNDLSTALRLLSNKLPKPHVGLAHSMGGAILLRALQTRRVDLDAAVFSAPMWGIQGLQDFQKRYARFMVSLGLGGTFAPNVEKKWKRENFKRNPVTHDKERHARCQGLVSEEPRLALAGPTIGWVAAAADATDAFSQPGALAHVRAPILVVTAGEEQLVDNASHDVVVEQLPDAVHVTIAGAKHEILMEVDPVRTQFWEAFDQLTARVAPVHA
jgi:alpha-beta hydrolase superfamily lysophospholipase